MDRRVLSIALLLTACAERRDEPRTVMMVIADAGARRALIATPPPIIAEPDAAPDEPTPPIKAGDVLSGPAAEQAIAEMKGTPREPPPADAPELRIHPSGVGPYEIGMTRREVAELLGKRGRFTRVRTAPGEISVEHADMVSTTGLVFMRMKIFGGRLTEIQVLGADARTRTDADIAVGSTFEDAILAHGEARRFGRGYVLSALPGVMFVAEDAALASPIPPPEAKIASIVVVGTQAD